METNTADSTEASDSTEAATAAPQASEAATQRRTRALAIGGAVVVCAALATAVIVTRHGGHDANGTAGARHAPTVPASYQVSGHGTAQITYPGPNGHLRTITTQLPWHDNADAGTADHPASVSIVLGKDGGTATCTIALHGKPVEQATAYGSYGRANCRAPLTSRTR
jgi:hypothetical protein